MFAGRKADLSAALWQLIDEVSAQYPRSVRSHLITTTLVKAESSVLVDRLEYLHEKYNVHHPHLYLIRPDGYIGFQGGIDAIEPLKHYLSQILIEVFQERGEKQQS